MSYLITGGTGFIGSYVVRNLLRHGQRVVCLDRSPDAQVVARFLSEVTVIECDLSERKQLAAVFDNHPEIDRVVHLAYAMGAESEADPPAAMRVNALAVSSGSCLRAPNRSTEEARPSMATAPLPKTTTVLLETTC